MKTHFLLAFALVAVAIGPAAVAAEDVTNETENSTEEIGDLLDATDSCTEPKAIDAHTVLCSAELDGNEAVLVLRSDRLQRITITDAGAFMAGGEVPQQRATLRAEEPNTVRMTVTVHEGFAGVSIDTGTVLYAVPLETSSSLIGGPWGAKDAQAAGAGAGVGVASVTLLLVWRRVYGRDDTAERVA